MANNKRLSDEQLAAYLDGNTSKAETKAVLEALSKDKELREILEITMSIDDSNRSSFDVLPMVNMAAENSDNICSVLCESFVLHKREIPYVEKELLDIAKENKWLTPKGTPLYAIGQLLAHYGLMITRRYNAGVVDISQALSVDNDVIVAVDSDKLYPNREDLEDAPNHAVVVLSVNTDSIGLFDPSGKETMVTVAIQDFLKAWSESRKYLVRVLQSVDDYEPQPIDSGDIQLTDDLLELREAIAENAHEVWAAARKKEGWTYGKIRDDANKKHPDIVPYSSLPDSEKEYDRIMAIDTIKLVRKLGFDIIKK